MACRECTGWNRPAARSAASGAADSTDGRPAARRPRTHPSQSPRTPCNALAASSSRRSTQQFATCGFNTITPSSLVISKLVNPAAPCAWQVWELPDDASNGGWLRFDGPRLAEERGACYVQLRRPDLAENALGEALRHDLSTRRRASVLTDLAMVGLQRGDVDQLTSHTEAALEIATRTGSGFIGRRLQELQGHLKPLFGHSQVRQLDQQIIAVTRNLSHDDLGKCTKEINCQPARDASSGKHGFPVSCDTTRVSQSPVTSHAGKKRRTGKGRALPPSMIRYVPSSMLLTAVPRSSPVRRRDAL